MSGTPTTPEEPARYAIRVRGHLDDRWAARFPGFSLTRRVDGTTVLTGPVADEAALHGWLRRVRDLALPLISVVPVAPDAGTEPPTSAAASGDEEVGS